MTTRELYQRIGPMASTLYGLWGSGKTCLALSSFCNPFTGEQFAEGRWVRIGGEGNPAIRVPPDSTKHCTSHKEFIEYLDALREAIRKGLKLDALVIDGVTEWSIMYLTSQLGQDTMTTYKKLKDAFMAIISKTAPEVLNCQVIWTARVDEKRSDIVDKTGKVFAEGDPDFLTAEYIPAVGGKWAKINAPYYSRLVLYVQEAFEKEVIEGKTVDHSVHRVHLRSDAGFACKNDWKHRIPGHPGYLDNTTWPEVLQLLTGDADV